MIYIPPRIHLCKYSKDSCNTTVVKINEFVSGKICFLDQSLWNSSKVKFRLQFVYVCRYCLCTMVNGLNMMANCKGMKIGSPQKKYAGLFQQILAGSKFCQNPFRKYCRYRYGFTLLGKHHISRGHSRDLSKESSGFEMILLIFFTFMST